MGFRPIQGEKGVVEEFQEPNARIGIGKTASSWALMQKGASMGRTLLEPLLCPHTPMSWSALL
jgi:hypothetical protein